MGRVGFWRQIGSNAQDLPSATIHAALDEAGDRYHPEQMRNLDSEKA
jgi:hypothetical protein